MDGAVFLDQDRHAAIAGALAGGGENLVDILQKGTHEMLIGREPIPPRNFPENDRTADDRLRQPKAIRCQERLQGRKGQTPEPFP